MFQTRATKNFKEKNYVFKLYLYDFNKTKRPRHENMTAEINSTSNYARNIELGG